MIGKIRYSILSIILLTIFFFVIPVQGASMSKKEISLSVKQNGTSVTLSWKKRKNADGYQIYQYNEAGKRIKKISTKKLKYTFKELDMGEVYSFRIRAYQKKSRKTVYSEFSKRNSVEIPVIETKSTLKKLLETALQPVGRTMYVWGGGWNKEDTGAGMSARTIGVSSKWEAFFKKQKSNYNYKKTRYQIENGLDCSGYIGWCIYNICETESGKKGYVMLAHKMAKNFANRGWGTYRSKVKVKDYRAGDIMSSSGHVYMVVGQCSDGSVVLLHASPPGVQLCGTPSRSGKTNSKAVKLAKKYMKKYYPAYYKKYKNCSRGLSYLKDYAQMRWDLSGMEMMSDPEGYRNMSADQILKDLFG